MLAQTFIRVRGRVPCAVPAALLQGAVLRYFASLPWTPERHRLWPPAFRDKARALLLAAHRRPCAGARGGSSGAAAAGAGLWALPTPVVLQIVAAIAGRRTDWMAQAAQQAAQQGAQPGSAQQAARS